MDLNEDEDIKKYYCTEVRRKTFLCPWNRRCLLRRSFNEMIRNLHTSKSLQYDMYICAILQYCDSYLLGSDEPTPCSMAPWRKEPNQNTDNTTCSNLHQSIVLPQPHCDGYWKGPNCLLSHIKASTLRWMCWLRGEWQDLGGGRISHSHWEMWADRATEPKPPISQYWRQLRRLRSANFFTPWEVSASKNNFVISGSKFVLLSLVPKNGRVSLWFLANSLTFG